jgi:hypothetical protein
MALRLADGSRCCPEPFCAGDVYFVGAVGCLSASTEAPAKRRNDGGRDLLRCILDHFIARNGEWLSQYAAIA